MSILSALCHLKQHKLHQIINKNTIKVSYSCTPNMAQIISVHNKRIINTNFNEKKNDPPSQKCNCRKKADCPLNGNCQQKNVIYQATVTRQDNGKQETYVGLTENEFKTRYNGHKSSFNNESKKTSTTLSEYVWELKSRKIDFITSWKVLSTAKPFSPESKKCNLCLTEKYYIIRHPHISSLNKRNELASKCRHRRKYALSNTK